MAASPLSFVSLAVCLMVAVNVSLGSAIPEDHSHHREVRQIPEDVQEKAEAAKKNFHEAASEGAQRAHDLASAARAHLSQRVRRSPDYYYYGPAGEGMGPRFQSRHGSAFAYGRDRRDGHGRERYLERHDEIARERDERFRERQEREREREEREREREQNERERERDERRRERDFRETE